MTVPNKSAARRSVRSIGRCTVVAFAISILVPQSLLAATIIVDSTADDTTVNGDCTFREAIQAANTDLAVDNCAAGMGPGDVIAFAIPGSGSHTISISSNLPTVADATIIDGTTQSGASCGDLWNGILPTLQIVIDLHPFNTLNVSSNVIVRGLVLQNTGTSALRAQAASGVTIQCNFIGTNSAGDAAVGDGTGIFIQNSQNVTIGGGAAGEGNLISGGNPGIRYELGDASGSVVQGNFIGSDVTGSLALPNVKGMIAAASHLKIGGTGFREKNLISGNSDTGLELDAEASGSRVFGNYIGTNRFGTAAIPNGNSGLSVGGTDFIIGGLIPGEGNLVSGNHGFGIGVAGGLVSDGVQIQGNLIGTDASGTSAVPNAVGIFVFDSRNTQIGGTTASSRNVISGNLLYGIAVAAFDNTAGSIGTTIQGNFIGVTSSGAAPLGNGQAGIFFDFSAGASRVGGTTSGAGNLIAYNGTSAPTSQGGGIIIGNLLGSEMAPSFGTGIRIDGNSIFSNNGIGIDLSQSAFPATPLVDQYVPDGHTANDSGDADSGPNNLQNFPVITSAQRHASGTVTISGTLNSTPNSAFTLDFYRTSISATAGQGETYLGATSVSTDGSGGATFDVTFSPGAASGYYTATATASDGSTSEFSDTVQQEAAETGAPLDFDGDGLSDLTTTKSSNSGSIFRWTDSADSRRHLTTLGNSRSFPVPGDYNGDGKWQPGVVTLTANKLIIWSIKNDDTSTVRRETFGRHGDIVISGCHFTSSSVTALSYLRGRVLSFKELGSNGVRHVSLPAQVLSSELRGCADIDGDGIDEMIVERKFQSGTGQRYLVGYDTNGTRVFTKAVSDFEQVVVADTLGDSASEIGVELKQRDRTTHLFFFEPSVSAHRTVRIQSVRPYLVGKCAARDSSISDCVIWQGSNNQAFRYFFKSNVRERAGSIRSGFQLVRAVNFQQM